MKTSKWFFKRMGALVYLTIVSCTIFITAGNAQEVVTMRQPLTADSTSVWPDPNIPVCWENPDATDMTERTWVRQAVTNTWERFGNLAFTGWGTCPAAAGSGQGIRIRINDERPHVKRVGKYLDGLPAGMVLNFTFGTYMGVCATMTQFCIQAIAVHEFGHALGFTHDQNRLDAPEWCRADAQGTDGDWYVTEHDIDSVMNYCNPTWNNAGILSANDIDGVQALYPTYTAPAIDPTKWYRMITRVTAQCIHVQNANGDRRNALLQWPCEYKDQFYFRFESVAGGLYRIRSRYNRCFHVKGNSTAPRTPLWQWECSNEPHFYFELERTSDDWYRIRSNNDMCFHVAHGPNSKKREPLWQWECLNQPQFFFHLQEVNI